MSPARALSPPGAAVRTNDAAATHPGVAVDPPPAVAPRGRAALPYLAAFAAYGAVALFVWYRLLAGGLSVLPAGSADPGQEVWFLAWFEHALATGTDPFFSHAVYAPAGVNLLSNTAMPLVGLLVSPVTAAAGPVAAFDVATLLAPALSALGAFALCRRHVRWQPAAFVGGLVYGFGPFVATDLRYGHLDLTWLALPPLVWCCVEDLLLRRPSRPVRSGALLGLVVVAQFFVSTEMLAITAISLSVALAAAAIARPSAVRPALRAGWPGLGVAAGVAAALLAWPVWMVLAGPRHVAGPVWAHIGDIATTLASTVQPHAEVVGVAFMSGGNGGYLGAGLLAVLVAGAVAYRRDPAVRLAAATGVAAYVLSLGARLHVHDAALPVPLPAAVLSHVPLLESLIPARFAAVVDLCAGVVLAVTLDRVHRPGAALDRPDRPGAALDRPDRPGAALDRPDRHARARVGLAVLVAAVAVVPLALVPFWPYATRSLSRPAALAPAVVGGRAGGPVPTVVVYPDGSGAVADQMVWQAQDGFGYRLSAGYGIVPGPGGTATLSPRVDALWLVLAAGDVGTLRLPLSATTVGSVRSSLRALGADEVIVLPGTPGSRAVRRALAQCLGPPTAGPGHAAMWRLRRP